MQSTKTKISNYRNVFTLYGVDESPEMLVNALSHALTYYSSGYHAYKVKHPNKCEGEYRDNLTLLTELRDVCTAMLVEKSESLMLHSDGWKINMDPFLKFLEADTIGSRLLYVRSVSENMVTYLTKRNMKEFKQAWYTMERWELYFTEYLVDDELEAVEMVA